MNIYLLRHGETDWNRAGRLQGRTDIPLNEKGRAQMKHAGEILRKSGIRMDLILVSPLSRARESAEITAGGLDYPKEKILVEEMLIEQCFGEGEGLTPGERAARFPDDIFPGMESRGEILDRTRMLLRKMIDTYEDKEHILLVAHGAIFYALMSAFADGRFAYIGKSVIHDQGNVYLIRCGQDSTEMARYSEEKSTFADVDFYDGRII